MRAIIEEMEALGCEFAWNPGGKTWSLIKPILPPAQQSRLDQLLCEVSVNPVADVAFDAEVEIHLWRKDGTIR